MRQEEVAQNTDFRSFRKETEQVDAVYLTNEEVTKVAQLPLCGTHAIARDLFVVGCHTGMRFSDYSRLSMKDISRRSNSFYHTEVQDSSRYSCSSKGIRHSQETWGAMPKLSGQKFNIYIKQVCKEAGINELVTVRKEWQHLRCEKWELVSSHTARRTGLTNMYKAGIPTYRCMMVSGHKTEHVFLTYLHHRRKRAIP